MTRLSFDIVNSKQFFSKLLEDSKDYQIDKTSSRLAINCAMTAWHLSDWIYFEEEYDKIYKLVDFQERLKKLCPALQIMHDICTGSKHFHLTKHQSKVEESKLHSGEFSSDFSRDFDISVLILEMKDGTKSYFEDDLETVIDFWNKVFAKGLETML
ncbi:MAG: hypothetical protein AABY93_15710 [Bacteroidota bacterium]